MYNRPRARCHSRRSPNSRSAVPRRPAPGRRCASLSRGAGMRRREPPAAAWLHTSGCFVAQRREPGALRCRRTGLQNEGRSARRLRIACACAPRMRPLPWYGTSSCRGVPACAGGKARRTRPRHGKAPAASRRSADKERSCESNLPPALRIATCPAVQGDRAAMPARRLTPSQVPATAFRKLQCKTGSSFELPVCMKSGVPTGIRTPVSTVKGWCPRPLDDGDAENRLASFR